MFVWALFAENVYYNDGITLNQMMCVVSLVCSGGRIARCQRRSEGMRRPGGENILVAPPSTSENF